MCVPESYIKWVDSHPIELNRDQRTTVTRNENGYSDSDGQCEKCMKNMTKSSNVTNIREITKCDKNSTFVTKTRGDTGYRNLSQFKLKYFNSLAVYFLLLLIQQTSARATYFSPNPFYRHIRTSGPYKMSFEDQPDYARILEQCGNATDMDQRKIDLTRIKKMLESTINTSKIALQEANVSGNAFVDVYDPGNGKLEDYHRIWKNKKPEEYNLTWLFPNNKRLPKNYTESLPSEYQDQLTSGDIHSNVTQLLLESYVRLQHLAHGLSHVLEVIKRDGQKNHQEDILHKLRKIFEEAIIKSKRVLTEVGDFLKEMLLCDNILKELYVRPDIIQDFEYQEIRNWIIFREYANQLEFNIQAFQVLVDRIADAENGH